jgi:hypothetical protein
MNIKQQKLILHFLELLEKSWEHRKVSEINDALLDYISREQFIKIVLWLYKNHDTNSLAKKSDVDLLDLIGDDSCVLSYVIEQWKQQITARPTMSQDEVHEFFDKFQLGAHYLRDKPVQEWDTYDVSNYYSILYKRGKTRRVFAIFTDDVDEQEKYIVTTSPSQFFDTKEEAEDELQKCYRQGLHDSLKVMSLWKIE